MTPRNQFQKRKKQRYGIRSGKNTLKVRSHWSEEDIRAEKSLISNRTTSTVLAPAIHAYERAGRLCAR